MLDIQNLQVSVEDKILIHDLNLNVRKGELHVIMGPNGSGKSTLAKVIAGDPTYTASAGKVFFDVNFKPSNILDMDVSERAKEGIFISFQYPVEIPGLNNLTFLQTCFNSLCRHQGVKEMTKDEFLQFAQKRAKELDISTDFFERDLNADFSGGEKKQNEILQLSLFSPRLAILDETDSGLDVDSIKKVTRGIKKFRTEDRALLVITHYHRMVELLNPDHVHVLMQGRLRKSGDITLAQKIEEKGYDWLS